MLNLCLGFGLAIYCGYGPPGWEGIFQALRPMPPNKPDGKGTQSVPDPVFASPPPASLPSPSGEPGPGGRHEVARARIATVPDPAAAEADPPTGSTVTEAANTQPAGPLAEDSVLSEVRELAAAAQTALTSAAAQARPE